MKGEEFMKKGLRIALVVLLAFSMFALAGCGDSAATDDKKVLKVGSDIAYAPFEYMDTNGEPVGFDIDLMTAIAEDMGYGIEFETSPFDGLIMSLNAGNYDAVISAMTITEERSESVTFSDPYFLATQLIGVKEGSDIKGSEDLKGHKVGVQLSTTGQFAVEDMGITPFKYETTPDALNDLVNGGVDAVVADSPVVLWFIKQNPNANLQPVEGTFEKEYYGIAMKKGNTELADQVNASLKKLKENGTYNDIYKKWFNTDAPSF